MIAIALSLNLLNLGQDIAQLGVVEVAATGTAAVDTKSGGAGNKCGDDAEGDHCDV